MAATESEVMSVGGLFPILVGIAASGSDPAALPDRIVLVNPVTRRVAVLQGDSAAISEMLSDVVAGGGGGGGGVPPASKRSIEAMGSVEVGDDDGAQECPVCLDELKKPADDAAKEVVVKEMPCRHRFHGDCIEKWLGMHGSCPVCRYRMPEEEEEEESKAVAAAEESRREVQVTIVIRRPTASAETAADDLD